MFEEIKDKRPIKKKNLKIIEHLGTYYATFDGSKLWKIEKWLFRLLMLCNGKKTVSEISKEIERISGIPAEEIEIGLKPVLEELEKEGLITYL